MSGDLDVAYAREHEANAGLPLVEVGNGGSQRPCLVLEFAKEPCNKVAKNNGIGRFLVFPWSTDLALLEQVLSISPVRNTTLTSTCRTAFHSSALSCDAATSNKMT